MAVKNHLHSSSGVQEVVSRTHTMLTQLQTVSVQLHTMLIQLHTLSVQLHTMLIQLHTVSVQLHTMLTQLRTVSVRFHTALYSSTHNTTHLNLEHPEKFRTSILLTFVYGMFRERKRLYFIVAGDSWAFVSPMV